MFSAYFDASGNSTTSVLTVCGFVSRVSKWNRFNEEWAALLAGENVSSFHMTDFVSSKGEFSEWKGQSARRKRFIGALAECINRNTNKGFGSSVVISDFEDVNRDYLLREMTGTPYVMSMRAALGGITRWATRKGVKTENLLVAIESGDESQGELIKRARQDGFKVVPLDKADASAFQAGDMAAWKFRTAIHNTVYGPMTKIEDMESVLRSMDPIKHLVQNNGVYDKESMLKLCDVGNVPRR